MTVAASSRQHRPGGRSEAERPSRVQQRDGGGAAPDKGAEPRPQGRCARTEPRARGTRGWAWPGGGGGGVAPRWRCLSGGLVLTGARQKRGGTEGPF